MPVLKEILPALAISKLQGYDTRQQEGLQIKKCMDIIQTVDPTIKVIKPQKWDKGLATSSLTNMLFMPHFSHIIHASTYVKQLLVCVHRG